MSENVSGDGSDWSYSTAQLFNTCPRAFYFHQQTQSADPKHYVDNDSEISINHAESPGALVGAAVHQSISRQIDCWRAGDSPSMVDAQSIVTELIREFCDTHTFPAEHRDTAADDSASPRLQDSLARTANAHLQTFFQVVWPQFSSHQYIVHETVDSFTVHGHTVWVRPDLCTRNVSGELIVTDWKTSPVDRFDQSLQLVVYALWAHRKYEPDLDRILAQQVHTGTGEFNREPINQKQLVDVIERIVTDCEEWDARGDRLEYPPDPEANKCCKCRYLDQCDAGQSVTQ